jgi:hypothetical protein
VLAASSDYPQVTDLLKALSEICERVSAYDATWLAMDAEYPQTLNVVMLSTLSRLLPLTTIEDVVAERVPKKALDVILRHSSSGSESSTPNSVRTRDTKALTPMCRLRTSSLVSSPLSRAMTVHAQVGKAYQPETASKKG